MKPEESLTEEEKRIVTCILCGRSVRVIDTVRKETCIKCLQKEDTSDYYD